MPITLPAKLSSGGFDLETTPDAFGELRRSNDAQGDFAELRRRMDEDGYLFLPGFFHRDEVMSVRRTLAEALAQQGYVVPGTPIEELIAPDGLEMYFKPDLAVGNKLLEELIYGQQMMDFYSGLLDGPARHFDYTWLRAVAPGCSTLPHCDIVYMGRGTTRLYTAWVPLGDVPITTGGLIVLEGSHKIEPLKATYGTMDVDVVCTNSNGVHPLEQHGWHEGGYLSENPIDLRRQLGGRWLTSEFLAGDLLTFSMFTVHASLDNRSNTIRMSSDSRYQLASDPIDERWVGEHPIGHGDNAKKGMIC